MYNQIHFEWNETFFFFVIFPQLKRTWKNGKEKAENYWSNQRPEFFEFGEKLEF